VGTVESRNDIKTEWSQHDDNCSKACTRSGVAVLLLTAFALSILPSLGKIESLNALLGYISRRITLKEELTRLQDDPVWKRLKASDPSAETWELGKLLKYTEDRTPKKSTSESVSPAQQSSKESIEGLPGKTGVVSAERVSPESPPVEVKEKAIILPPAAATGLTIRELRGIGPISIIIKTLEELSDGAFLVRAQKYSYRYEIFIYRWFLLLNRLYEENTSDDSSKGQETKTPGMKISKLTLPQVEQLVNVDGPEISEAERLSREALHCLQLVCRWALRLPLC
jgi:hypothetical protein